MTFQLRTAKKPQHNVGSLQKLQMYCHSLTFSVLLRQLYFVLNNVIKNNYYPASLD